MSISSVIPLHHKASVAQYLRVKSILLGLAAVGLIQFFVAIAFLIIQCNIIDLVLNLSTALYALISIYFIRCFRRVESFLNIVFGGFYLYLFALIATNGGLLADAVFWLAPLLTLSILFTTRKHAVFWAVVIGLFISAIYSLGLLGVDFTVPEYTSTHRLLNLISFFSPLVISGMIYSSIYDKSTRYQLKMLDRLEKKQVLQKDLIDEITHDLKSPTNRILGLIQLFDHSNLREEQLEIMELIKKTNESSSHIINAVLNPDIAYTKAKESVDIGQLLQELERTHRIQAHEKRITIQLDVLEGLMVSINRYGLMRVLDNLITNAIKYSHVGGDVTIEARSEEQGVSILIADSGPGFSQEDRELLYKRTTLTAKPTGNEKSHGLGLHIVNKLALELGISVSLIESSMEGSVFEVVVPTKS